MKFYVTQRNTSSPSKPKGSYVILERDNWDDYHFKTSFRATIHLNDGNRAELGAVKILKRNQEEGETEFRENSFSSLSEDYCSLGQSIEYYERLKKLPNSVRDQYLVSIRDAAFRPGIALEFKEEKGWRTSLLRFGQAEHALSHAASIFNGEKLLSGRSSFKQISKEFNEPIQFDFDDSGPLPGRCNVLIGYNGVGKTRLLADIARETSRVGLEINPSVNNSGSSTFSSVIAVSYSAFDTFEVPQRILLENSDANPIGDAESTTFFGYTYCGLRRFNDHASGASWELKSINELNTELSTAFKLACERGNSSFAEALADLNRDPSFGRAGITLTDWVEKETLSEEELRKLSAGQKIVLNIIVQLSAHLRTRSLVLIDEPETHLHPPLLASLLRGIQRLLDSFDAFAVIATHSPVVLQEVPAKDVRMIERFGDTATVIAPQRETFGSNLGELTHEIFRLDNTVADYRAVIRQLAETMTLEEIEGLFTLGLSSQARALVLRAQRKLRG